MVIPLSVRPPLHAITYMIHHTFLPPNVPQEDDFDPRNEETLLCTLSDALQQFKAAAGSSEQGVLESISTMISNLRSVREDSGAISEANLERALQKLSEKGGVMPLYIRAQNAGVIISKVSDGICFEIFELSPDNESVITTKGRLRRSFPASACVVNQVIFNEDGFQATLAQTIAKMSHQAAPDMQPKVRKARQQHNENRDATHPRLVTEHLMSFLMASGTPTNVSTIWKNTREEVMWKDSFLPWRRSPMWLLIRVAMQLQFSRQGSNDLYKAFMVFFLAHVLRLSHENNLRSDVLCAMNAKLSRRLFKLGVEQAKPWIHMLEPVMSETHSLVNRRWQNIRKKASPDLDLRRLMSIEPKNDTATHLPKLDRFIATMSQRKGSTSSHGFEPSSKLPSYPPDDLSYGLDACSVDYLTFNLAAFESWVECNLPNWLDHHVRDVMTCGHLKSLIESYHQSATSQYAGNPEGSSVMLLTIMELWVACDKSACALYDLLPDFDPEIPVELLQSLVLPFKGQMSRLSKIEGYIQTRQRGAKSGSPSLLYSFGDLSAFSVRYFDQSLDHQALLSRIETQASREREEKCMELCKKKEEYRTLMQYYDQSTCVFYEVVTDSFHGFCESRHRNPCSKCQSKEQAAAINIDAHEWPLPSNRQEAKSVVFELMVPAAFGQWRDATTFLLNDILGCNYSAQDHPWARHTPQNYKGLSSFFVCSSPSALRVGLLSQVKPHTNTHRRNKTIAVTVEEDVCLHNGLQYQYYDSDRDTFTSPFRATDTVLNLCTYKLPQRSLLLQEFLARPPSMPSGLSPNTVIAQQSDCPVHLSLDEFKALCSLPLGYRIQWMNILVQLSTPSIDFTKVETSIFLLQVIYQAGPPNGGSSHRASHDDLANESFGHAILFQLRNALQRVEKNWESSLALQSFVHLAARLLSFSSSAEIQDKCLKYLASARRIAFGWVTLLEDKAIHSIDDDQRTEFLLQTINVALVCASTFDVEQRHLRDILSSSSEASVLIQCSITIQENLRSTLDKPALLIVLERWRKLSYRALPMLVSEILEKGSTCLDDAVRSSWSDYQHGSSWVLVDVPHHHWLSSTTAARSDSGPLSVHFNLLTAELLVNGRPLARLPIKYESHAIYGSLFGHSALEVMPSLVPGMEFSTKAVYAGFTIHLGMQATIDSLGSPDTDLLLHAVRGDRKYDLLPSRVFRGKLPVSFIDDFTHWYDHVSNSIEFRPIENPWSSSPANWWLTKVASSWRLARNGVVLISVSSNSAQTLLGILSALEEPLQIHLFFHGASESLDIEVPRLRLSFDLQPGSTLLRSRQFSDMFIDTHQDIGTLVGLQNKLVLKHEKPGHDRIVIIPEGRVTYQRTLDHVMVNIDQNTAVKAQAYYIDKRLGRIVDSGDLQSKLFLGYLNGLTSYCLPDPLTQRTGTEQALWMLSSAAVRSFDVLTRGNLAILEHLARLAPGRAYYPANERVMHAVTWDSELSFLSQHGSFFTSVEAIFEQANVAKIFHPETHIEVPNLDFTTQHLLQRDLIRSSTFRVSDFGAEQYTIEQDATYSPRDRGQCSKRASRAFVIASLLFQNRAVLHTTFYHGLRDSLWKSLNDCGTIDGPKLTLESTLLKFDSKWLKQPLGAWWCRAHLSLSHSRHQYNRFLVMMWLSTAAYSESADMSVIYTIAAFYNVANVAQITPPPINQFQLHRGARADLSELKKVIQSARRPFTSCADARLPKLEGESQHDAQQRRKRLFQGHQDRAINHLATELERQWPCEAPQTPPVLDTYLNTSQAMTGANLKFKTWFENYRFFEYLGHIEDALQRQVVEPIPMHSHVLPVPESNTQRKARHISSAELFNTPPPSIFSKAPAGLEGLVRNESGEAEHPLRLGALLDRLDAQVRTKCEEYYGKRLRSSLLSLKGRAKKPILDPQGKDIMQVLDQYLDDCNQHVQQLYSSMVEAITGESHTARGLAATIHQWPRVSPSLFLQELTYARWDKLATPWKECLIKYGLALTEVQRAERLVNLASDPVGLVHELLNTGHRNWNPFEFPESLLLEVESGIMIREVQEDIAHQMRSPPSDQNAVMQLNMGEGKSTVALPIVALKLADGKQLVRVFVAKPQSKQMFEILVAKLGSLLGRRIYHMPFSRALRLDQSQADAIGSMCRDCMANRGILLLQPEHILSFKLMGIECLETGHESVGQSLLTSQHFFDTRSRDIIDESDENFSVKFELIYTMGTQRPIELSPERWEIIQSVLGLIARFVREVKRDLPLSIEVDDRWLGRFPKTRILRDDAYQPILEKVADHICKVGLFGLPVSRQPVDIQQKVFKYITKSDLTAEEAAVFESKSSASFWTDSRRSHLLLVRGLIAGGVLSFALACKRWRVDYGPDPHRLPKTKLAVPFRAKDSPTPRSEFSHPDIVIVLTALSYYYGGLDDDDLFASFGHLLKSDQAQLEYGEWVYTASEIPDSFRQLSGVNVKDRFQCVEQLFPSLRYSKGAIDYFLSHLIFPKEMKEFPHKISASGWDIGQIKTYPTTGFSGTNDSRHLLPLSVQQLDLPEQEHTNALVLEYLLGDENSVELLPQRDGSTESDAEFLLATVSKMVPAVRVILDVGAQILELDNLQVAKTWLDMRTFNDQTKAVIFFSQNDELLVLDRKGQIEPLQTSPFAKQLDACLVFLDQAHTRGTDLKLPTDYRAAVTLGANLTKDRLVQACMRMRKLGKGQSVVFCVPEEIKRKISERTLTQNDIITVADVLIWTICETCVELRRSLAQWATQGLRFENQKGLWASARSENGFDFSRSQVKEFLEEEAQTLNHRYGPRAAAETPSRSVWDEKNQNIGRIIERCQEFESLHFDSATLQEEQERELSPEIEQERQVERPAPAVPERHCIHNDLKFLIMTGEFKAHSPAFLPAFEALRSSSAATHLDVSQFPRDLYVTADFARTIKTSGSNYVSDAYQRPVQWILTCTGPSTVSHLVVISPFEVQELLDLIREYRRVTLHLYAPRSNLEFRPLDALDLFTVGKEYGCLSIPRHLIVQLNLFAGQLYLSSFKEYIEVCDFLGLAWRATEQGLSVRGVGGFTVQACGNVGFHDGLVMFFKVLMMKIRRNCESIEKTHLGKILHGAMLEERDFANQRIIDQ
ncbi:hypothetical protein HYALB_00001729 [Hymenoscyphus albidus]|uniref:ubiquitinyl hydrolase 1 n=1 Tax=Hymenoscyphus albidus TaxID=595503 RepID=A0A9N9LGS3_9HELO|nr:hypothetical protein HYALB_00001729 [Hymenoscyphus albidus]